MNRASLVRIPAGPDGITVDWLNAVLETAAVRSADVVPIAAGVGFMSRVYRVSCESNAGQRCTFVVKLAASPGVERDVATAFGSYAKEVTFYRSFAHLLPNNLPGCHYADIDHQSGDYVVLLEDLEQSGSTAANQLEGASVDETINCLRTLGRIHGSLRQVDLAALGSYADAAQVVADDYPRVVPACFTSTSTELAPAARSFIERYAADAFDLSARQLAIPHTLAHIDCRADNVYFRGSSGEPVFLDWGDCCHGPGVFDVAHWLMASVSIEVRREIENVAIEAYHDALCATGQSDYSLEQCRVDYLAILPAVFYIQALIAVTGQSSERGRKLGKVVIERANACLEDALPVLVSLYE